MRRLPFVIAAIAIALPLTACAPSATPEEVEVAPPTEEEQSGAESSSDGLSFAHIASCDDVKPFVATWTEGFVPYEWNSVSDSAIQCGWNSPPEETNLDNIRSVEVNLTQLDERPDYSPLEGLGGFASISDDWVDAQEGLAYAMTVDIGLSAVIGTTVWVPGVEATVSGGRWANLPELGAPAALEVVKALLAS